MKLPLVLLLALGAAAPPAVADPTRLVVLISVDQLRRDRLDPALPGGLGRIAREGRVYAEGALDHAGTATCPGHVSLVSGRHPGRAGVPGNRHLERGAASALYCVDDPESPVLGAPGIGRSPAKLRVDTLGDWIKAAHPAARVFGVSAKDRSAIAMGGHRADAAWWLDAAPPGGFTTSRYYRADLPDWVAAFNGGDPLADGFLAGLPAQWEPEWRLEGPRPDDFAGESELFGRAFPHPLRGETPDETLRAYAVTPFPDTHTLEFAKALIRNEGLGRDDAPDLIAIGLSSTDRVGHLYGPESWESYDALRRLDRDLQGFLEFLDADPGLAHTLVVLSADHGVLPLPEWLAQTGRATCPVEGGRVEVRSLMRSLLIALWWEFTPFWDWPRSWLHFGDADVNVDRALAEEHGVDVQAVIDFTEAWLEEQPVIAAAWTHDEILGGTDEYARLYRNSFDPERSGDLVIQVAEGCLITSWEGGTTHGTPYAYDRDVPIVFFGAGVEPGTVPGRARTVDIAPSVAEHLGIARPADLDGAVLP